MFLWDHWYAAAWSEEVTADRPFGRMLLNQPVVLYRKADGTAVALEDRCCHRWLPLSMGKVVDDRLQCHYHGLTFEPDGTCVRVPGQDLVPPGARVRTYPVSEQWGLVWVFMGDPALADPAKVPDYHWITDPAWGCKGTLFHVQANYQLIIDNLLDLTHLAFVHMSTIGNAAVVEQAKVKFSRGPETVDVERWMHDTPPPPTYAKAAGFTGNIDRWQLINFTPPGFIRLKVGGRDAGSGDDPSARRLNMRNLNILTPETETTTHYFWAQAQDVAPCDPAVTEMVFNDVKIAFLQDQAVFEGQQRSLDNLARNGIAVPPRIDVNGDAGGLQARRIMERLLAEQDARRPRAAE